MVSTAGDFPFLAECARRYVAILAGRPAFDLKKGERGSALIKHIDYTAAGLKSGIEEVEDEYHSAGGDLGRQEAFKRLRLLAGYAHFMRRALPWLEDAKKPPMDLGALYFIDQVSEALLGEVADVIPTRASEYSTEQQPFEPLFAELNLSPDPTSRRSIILNFPALEVDSFPLLPLFGHEIGHTVVTKASLTANTLSRAKGKPDYVEAVDGAKKALASQPNLSLHKATFIIDERLENWTTELLCDQLAMQYLGPSYLLAFAAYVVPLTWNAPGPRHPPTTFRIAHLLHWIARTPWETLLKKRMPVAFAWLEKLGGAPRTGVYSPALSLLLDALDVARLDISSIVSDSLEQNVYTANAYLAQSRHLDDQLRYNVLPVQHPSTLKAFDPRAILISGWLSLHEEAAKAGKEGETPATICRTLARSNSNAFFTKALEVRQVLDTWEQIA